MVNAGIERNEKPRSAHAAIPLERLPAGMFQLDKQLLANFLSIIQSLESNTARAHIASRQARMPLTAAVTYTLAMLYEK